ncbi:lipopolysaccharide heptosyltransferase II [bacterium]|nr:lipopolysaccharide heptosyltransferase II [bacterium]
MSKQTQGPKKILLRSPNWVGDAVMGTPVVVALKKTFPHAAIHVLARSWVAPLWENHPAIDCVIGLDRKLGWVRWIQLIMQLRKEKYDLTILLTNAFSAAWLAFWSGIPKRVGYRTDNRGWLLTQGAVWNKSLEQIARPKIYLTLARLAGADVDLCEHWDFVVKLTSEEIGAARSLVGPHAGQRLVGIAPGSVAKSRRWPVKRYAQIVDRLTASGFKVVLVGSPVDAEAARQVARQAKNKPLITAGQTGLRTGLAVIKQLALLISNDSGAMHMAYAQDVPVLVLQGAADPAVTGPFGKHSAYLRDHSLACAPCVRNECKFSELKCMQHISVEQVWEKIREMLKIKSRKK